MHFIFKPFLLKYNERVQIKEDILCRLHGIKLKTVFIRLLDHINVAVNI